MSRTTHKAIVVTGELYHHMLRAHRVASGIFPPESVTNLVIGTVNGSQSFMIAPSGSKDGWEEDEDHYQQAEKFSEILMQGDILVEAVVVMFGSDLALDDADARAMNIPINGSED